jgi:hypothetical protein
MPRRRVLFDLWASPLVRALPELVGQRPDQGPSPFFLEDPPARHSLASRPAA